MEHRHFPRHAENFNVILKCKRGGTVHAQVLDVSREGMRISMSGLPIPKGCIIEVIMPEDRSGLFDTRHLHGFVVYADDGTIGLWLDRMARHDRLMAGDK